MQRFALKWIAIAVIALGALGCANEGVGDPCVPESIPCEKKLCGFASTESYVESSAVQCRSRVCIVSKLKGGKDLADPRDVVGRNEGIDWSGSGSTTEDGPAAVTEAQLESSVYCTCRCRDSDGKKVEGCDCPGGYKCEQVLSLGGEGIRGSYCVRTKPAI